MSKLLRRQLSEDEKQQILQQFGKVCFATGHTIADGESIDFDHIRAWGLGAPTELNNIAPMCSQHNKEKGQLPLEDFRTKLRLKEFFSTGDKLTLKDLLEHMKTKGDITAFAQPVTLTESNGSVTVESANRKYVQSLYTCPTTGWKYFYATLDVDVIDSDDDEDHSAGLQPRYLIFEKVFELYRHFQRHPVLQPTVGRVVGSRIRLFDGQHKTAALLWGGRRSFECKIYLSPDVRLLNQTNIAAHDKFAQTRFFSSIMVTKLGAQFGKDFEAYKNLEDGQAKTESGLIDFIKRQDGGTATPGELNQRFRDYLYDSVLEHPDNKLPQFVSDSNRSLKDKPITMDVLQKSLFTHFLYLTPTGHDLTAPTYMREAEIGNVVALMNLIVEHGLHAWNAKAATSDSFQMRLNRMFGSKSMMAWSDLLGDAICGKLDIQDRDEREKPFYREFTESDLSKIANIVKRLFEWSKWNSPVNSDIDRILSDNKQQVKSWFKNQGLTTGYLMGAPE
jgi:hypothetical protein